MGPQMKGLFLSRDLHQILAAPAAEPRHLSWEAQ